MSEERQSDAGRRRESEAVGSGAGWRFGRPRNRLRQAGIILAALPGWLASRRQRRLLREMRAFVGAIPAELEGALPAALESLTPAADASPAGGPGEVAVRRLADLASLLERRSPVGKCLRRSLVRYHFLRRAGVAVEIHFGARVADGHEPRARRLTGHAWVVRDGQPYHERPEDLAGYEVVVSWPSGPERAGPESGT